MARPSGTDYQPVDDPAQPSLADARLAAINQTVAPDTTLEPEHPAVTFAKGLLSPMGPYGQSLTSDTDTTPAPPQPFYQPPQAGFDPGQTFGNVLSALQAPGNAIAQHLPGYTEPGAPGSPEYFGAQVGRGKANTDYQPTPAEIEASSGRLNAVLGLTGGLGPEGAPRYTVEAGKTRSLIRDTTTGETTPTIYGGADHAAKAQAAADELNSGAQAAKTMAAPEAQMTGALSQIPTEVETAVRRQARATPQMTAEDMVNTPNMLGQIQLALAKAKLPATDENALSLAQQLLAQEKARPTAGNKVAAQVQGAVADALGVRPANPSENVAQTTYEARVAAQKATGAYDANNPIDFGSGIPKPVNVPASAEQTAANAGTATAAQQAQNDMLQQAIAKRQGAMPGGQMPPDVPLPASPKGLAERFAASLEGTVTAVSDLPRAATLIGHLPLIRQAPPLIADTVLRQNPVAAAKQLARMVADTAGGVASERIFNSVYAGQRQLLDEAGIKTGLRYGGADSLLSPIHGPLSATEEYGLRSIFARSRLAGSAFGGAIGATQGDTPEDHLRNALIGAGIGAGVPNINRAFPSMLNSLRTGAAVDLARMQKQAYGFVKSDDIVHTVRIISGKGDLPGGATTAKALNGIFFGPRLATSSWQYPAEVLGAIKNMAGDLGKRPLNPTDIMKIRSAAGYVATGIGIMKIANAFGLDIQTNSASKDWGRIVLPDGSRADLWGQFGPDARLIAQSLDFVNRHVIQRRPVGPLEDTPWDMGMNYIRGKLNVGVPSAVGNVLAGKTMGGAPVHAPQSGQDVIDAVTNSTNWPQPLAVQEAQTGGGGLLGAAKIGLVGAGASIINTPQHINYDGLGTPEGQPTYNNAEVLREYSRLATAEGKDPVMTPPPPKIGNGTKHELQLPATEQDKYVQAVGQEREHQLGVLIYSQKYQDATMAQQQKMFSETVAKADRTAEVRYLANGVVQATDPATIRLEALNGFADQQNNKDRAYWVSLLDRAGKLTPEVTQAIDALKITNPDDRLPYTVAEYRKAGPLVHEYLAHVPYGTDAHPIGTPADWSAVAQAHIAKNNRVDELVRSGTNPSLADAKAQAEIVRAMTSLVQRNLFLNGTQLENPQRRLLALKFPTLKRFLGPDSGSIRESESEYQNFGQ